MGIAQRAQAIRADLHRRRARLPWAELEAEAHRQGCSPADLFFDWAARASEPELGAPGARSFRRRSQTPLDAVGRRGGLRIDPAGRTAATDRHKEEKR